MLVGKKTNSVFGAGLIYAPYIIQGRLGRSDERDVFWDHYNTQRKHCPVCGSIIYSTTLVGYILVMDDKDNYQDKNRCVCQDCGDTHTFHERVSKQHLRKSKIERIWKNMLK